MNVLKTLRTLGCGVLVGTAGLKVLASADAKKVYTHATAAVKRGVDEVMKTVTNIRENCQDISADADEINGTLRKFSELQKRRQRELKHNSASVFI